MDKKKRTKETFAVLKNLRYLWWLFHVLAIIAWLFSIFTLLDYIDELTINIIRQDNFIDIALKYVLTYIVWLQLLLIICKIFAIIKLKYCFFMMNESIVDYIDKRLNRDRLYKKDLLNRLQWNGVPLDIEECNFGKDGNTEVKYKVNLGDTEIYRNTIIYSTYNGVEMHTNIEVKKYVSYEVLAYLYFEIRRFEKVISATRSQERKEKEDLERLELENTVFHPERKGKQ